MIEVNSTLVVSGHIPLHCFKCTRQKRLFNRDKQDNLRAIRGQLEDKKEVFPKNHFAVREFGDMHAEQREA
jgi:hypothetical protein